MDNYIGGGGEDGGALSVTTSLLHPVCFEAQKATYSSQAKLTSAELT